MILIYASLVIAHLAGASCRTVELDHDLDEDNNGQIADFLLPLLGSNDKNEIDVEVVPYQDYNEKSKTDRKPVAAITPMESTKKESPLAVILANAKFRKNKKSQNGKKIIDLPFWDNAEKELNADDFDADTSIIIHVKRKKENQTNGKNAKKGHKNYTLKSNDETNSISEENISNEHHRKEQSGEGNNEDYFVQLAKDKLQSNIETKYVESKHQNVKNVENNRNIPYIRRTPTYGEEIEIFNDMKDKGKPQYELPTNFYLSRSGEVLEPNLSNEFEIKRGYEKNAVNVKNAIKTDTVSVKTDAKNFEEHTGSTDIKESEINVSSNEDAKVDKREDENDTSSSKVESSSEQKSSDEDKNENSAGELSARRGNFKKNTNQELLQKVTQNYDHQESTNINSIVDNKPVLRHEEETLDNNINKIYHPNLQFQTKPLLMNSPQLKEKFTQNLREVGDVPTNKALLKTYKLLLDKEKNDKQDQLEILGENNIKNSNFNQQQSLLHNSYSNKNTNALTNVVPKNEIQAKNLIHDLNLDTPVQENHSLENVPLAEDTQKDIPELELDRDENTDTPDDKIILESNTEDDKDGDLSIKDISIVEKKQTPIDVNPLNTHVSTVSNKVLLNGGRVIKYEAPTNIKLEDKLGDDISDIKDIDQPVTANENFLTRDKSPTEDIVKNVDEIPRDVAPNDVNYDRDGESKNDENNIIVSNNKRGIIKISTDADNVKKDTVILHPRQTANSKILNREIDAIATFLKRRNLLNSKQNLGSKSYNLSFLFNRR